jgi:hypothetical protein
MRELESFSDADFRRTILRALRLLLVLTLVALPVVWWRGGGWRSGMELVVGAAISGSGLWEWLRLLTALMRRMDASPPNADGTTKKQGSMGLLLFGFFLRLAVVVAVLYASLRFLEGSVIALAVGLGLGVVALTVEGLRLVKAWTV